MKREYLLALITHHDCHTRMSDLSEKLEKKAQKLGLNRIERHIFLCADMDECKCASAAQMKSSWKYLKRRIKELGLKNVARSRTQCLDICCAGPICVVYPEGVWYAGCDEQALEHIIQRHLLKGEIASEYVITQPNKQRRLG